jgi:PAS domain S-box-containing protein
MTKKGNYQDKTEDLRKRAETAIRIPDTVTTLSPDEARQTLHELQVHQIELEIQNEELRRTQEELEASREQYFELYDLAPIGYFTSSEKGLILHANLRAAEMLDTTRNALTKLPLSSFILPEDQDIYYRHQKKVSAKGRPKQCELRLVRKDGTQFWARLETVAAEDGGGNTIYRIVVDDITEKKQAQDALRKAHDELEVLIRERTAELTKAYEKLETETTERAKFEEQLRQSQKMEAIGTLAGGIAHDFNNILAGIIGFAEMALEDIAPDHPAYHNMEQVLRGGHRGRDLVRQILAFSRHTGLEKKSIAMAHVVEEVLKLLRPALPTTIEIQTRLHGVRDTVLADPVQMHQVIMNLCTNAAYAMRDTGGVLSITITDKDFPEDAQMQNPDLNPGACVCLSVNDNGCGMAPDVIERIFDPFFTTKAPGEGTGMGLSVVHGIVRNHGGHITVNSEPGRGSTFHVYLPRTKAVGTAAMESLHPIPGGSECILFVDDEEMLVELNLQRLGSLGYNVVATTNSVEALRTFASEPDKFDLVITDYTMPHMTGVDLARKLLEIRPGIPIILSSGLNEQLEPEVVAQMGIKTFMAKTVGKRTIAELIRKVLEQ